MVNPSNVAKVPPVLDHTKNLMDRLQAFLPQMQTANQELLSGTQIPRVDLELQSEQEDNSSDSDSDGSSNENAQEHPSPQQEGKGTGGDTIQVQFAVGQMEGNPVMKLLLDDDNSDNDSSEDSSKKIDLADDTGPSQGRKRALIQLLEESDARKKAHSDSQASDILQSKTDVKKSLITEIE